MSVEPRSRATGSRGREAESRFDLETVGRLLCLMAHDLRNPLSALGSSVQYLQSVEGGTSPDGMDALVDAQLSGVWLLQLTDNLDMLGRSLSGRLQLPRDRFAFVAPLEEAMFHVRTIAESYRVPLQYADNGGYRSAMVRSSRELLTLSISNMILNAIQHGVGGSVEVTVTVNEERCSLSVVDQGVALRGDVAQNELRPRGQIPNRPDGRYGRGLGLLIADLAAEACGAKLKLGALDDGRSCLELAVSLDR